MTPLVSTLLQLAVLAANIDPPADAEWPLNLGAGLDASAALTDCDPVLLTAKELTVPAIFRIPEPALAALPTLAVERWGMTWRTGAVWQFTMLGEIDTSTDGPLPVVEPPLPYHDPAVPETGRFHWSGVLVEGGKRSPRYLRESIFHHQWLMPNRETAEIQDDGTTPLTPFLPQIQLAVQRNPADEWLPGFGPDLENASRTIPAFHHPDPRTEKERSHPILLRQ